MAEEQRWSNVEKLNGWTVTTKYDSFVKQAHLKQHPKHPVYQWKSKQEPLSGAEEEAYDQLNLELHEQIRKTCIAHFEEFHVPDDIRKARGKNPFFSPFTYQNYDWYGTTYECCVVIVADYISTELLVRLQSLLHGSYQDWCIGLFGSNSIKFDDDFEMVVFSDAVIVSPQAVRDLNIPIETGSRRI